MSAAPCDAVRGLSVCIHPYSYLISAAGKEGLALSNPLDDEPSCTSQSSCRVSLFFSSIGTWHGGRVGSRGRHERVVWGHMGVAWGSHGGRMGHMGIAWESRGVAWGSRGDRVGVTWGCVRVAWGCLLYTSDAADDMQ
eukprot:6420720-Prymnesium_polylepis.2